VEPAGKLVPTALLVGQADPVIAGIVSKAMPSAEQIRTMTALAEDPSFDTPNFSGPPQQVAARGMVKNLVILCKFADHTFGTHTRQQADYNVLFNNVGSNATLAPTGSVKDYFQEASYGTMSFQSTVIAWVTLPNSEAYYANGDILESDENSVEYFTNLSRLSNTLVENKKYIVAPLMLIQNKVFSLSTQPLKLTFVDSVGNQLIFARDDGTTIKFPESHQSNQGLTHTFVFNKISTYDKFRTELSLKFDLTLPDVLSEGKKVDSFVDAVKKSEIKAGHAAKEAESIAWATANKRGMLNNKNTKKK
jgi:hypothetical protein